LSDRMQLDETIASCWRSNSCSGESLLGQFALMPELHLCSRGTRGFGVGLSRFSAQSSKTWAAVLHRSADAEALCGQRSRVSCPIRPLAPDRSGTLQETRSHLACLSSNAACPSLALCRCSLPGSDAVPEASFSFFSLSRDEVLLRWRGGFDLTPIRIASQASKS